MPLAIVIVLILVLIPRYFEYRAKQAIHAGLIVAAGARAAIEKAFTARGPSDMSLVATTGWSVPREEGTASISIAKDGAITLRYGQNVAPASANQIRIVPTSDGKPIDLSEPSSIGKKIGWICSRDPGLTTVNSKLLPQDCP